MCEKVFRIQREFNSVSKVNGICSASKSISWVTTIKVTKDFCASYFQSQFLWEKIFCCDLSRQNRGISRCSKSNWTSVPNTVKMLCSILLNN
ncbi:hypothetical protein FGIG_06317 [Fasciola gigantica]|uniref:Uncharacterized protein n=1 Tax=Fasciola gigantica TaxID=46835 RepID=A0A504YN45_FASGI|nr:hypothetical protein FGIG_06317 [Fasciola gigantica]